MRGLIARVRSYWHGLRKIGTGVVLGSIPAAALAANLGPEVSAGADGPVMAGAVCAIAALFMITVTTLACVVPARRALRIQPIDTLKAT